MKIEPFCYFSKKNTMCNPFDDELVIATKVPFLFGLSMTLICDKQHTSLSLSLYLHKLHFSIGIFTP